MSWHLPPDWPDGAVSPDLARFGLGPRLAQIAEMVPRGKTVADIGTDHGLLPIALVGSGRCPRAVAIDRADAPLARAKRNAERLGVEIDLRKGEGLVSGEADVAIIAGLGGRSICEILRSPVELVRIVVQPNTDFEEVRRMLASTGYASAEECFVADEHRFFLVMAFERGPRRRLSMEEAFLGRVASDPLFPAWAEIQRKHWSFKSGPEAMLRLSLLSSRRRCSGRADSRGDPKCE